jgi:hypothetical protein
MAKSSKEIIAAFVMDFERRRQAALRERLITVCQRQIRRVEEDMGRMAGRYGLHSGQEMQALHVEGRFQDGDSRRDLRRVEEMQAQLDRLAAFLQALGNTAAPPSA